MLKSLWNWCWYMDLEALMTQYPCSWVYRHGVGYRLVEGSTLTMLNSVSQNNVSSIVKLIPFMREGLITILCWGKLFQAFVKNLVMEDFVAPSKSPVYGSWLGLNNCMVIRLASIEVQTMLTRYITSQMHDIGFWAPLKNGRVVLLWRVNFYANLEFILWVIYQYAAATKLFGFGHLQVYLVHIHKMTSHNTHTNGSKWKSECECECAWKKECIQMKKWTV